MKALIIISLVSVVLSFDAYGQSALNQLKQMTNSNISVPPASKGVCAYCRTSNPYIHNAGCPYGNKSTSTSISTPSSSSTSTNSVLTSETGSLMSSVLSTYLSNLSNRSAKNAEMNAAAQKMIGVPGCEDEGYVVSVGTDGYYSIWDDNSKQWAFEEPFASTMTNTILYNHRAVCVQRWLGHKWGIFDLKKGKTGSANLAKKAIEFYKFDTVKCVAKDAPIAVGIQKGKNYRWGLVTKGDNVETWSRTVDTEWDDFNIIPTAITNFAIGHKDGKCALFAQNGTMLIKPLYDSFAPVFSDGTHTYFFVCLNALWGLVNELGEIFVPCEYDDIQYTAEGVAVKKDGEWYLVPSK